MEEEIKVSRLQRIQDLREQLVNTDYQVIKLMEGRDADDPNIMAKRQAWRELITTLEGMTDAEYEEYTEPDTDTFIKDVPSMDDIVGQLKGLMRSQIDALPDEKAVEVPALFSTWASKLGQEVVAGERLWYDGKLYKVLQPHTPQTDWTPDKTPALYAEVSIEEWPEIPENIPSTAPWMKGDKGTWKEQHYICQMDNCVWNPDQYPAAWKLA